jgi:hypothetical protein
MVNLYTSSMQRAGYEYFMTPRTNQKGDGLVTFVKQSQYRTLALEPIEFNDCANRVGQLIHLGEPSNN